MATKPMSLTWDEAQTLGDRIYALKRAHKESEHEFKTYLAFYGETRINQLFLDAQTRQEKKKTDEPDSNDPQSWP